LEELEALTAILDEDTVEIEQDGASGRPTEITIQLRPLTASEQDKQYVSLALVVRLPSDYPAAPPGLGIRNPRGLEESAVAGLLADMTARCQEYTGCPVLFELIELGREFLTERNVPVVRCIVCLYSILEEDAIVKTECLHFFHKHCLGRYITSMEAAHAEQVAEAASTNTTTTPEFRVTCPVCRETIGESRYNLADLLASAPPRAEVEEVGPGELGPEVRELQQRMAALYTRQKEKGGIIDLEAEQRKFLVVTHSLEDSKQQQESFTELSPTDYHIDNSGLASPGLGPGSPTREEWDYSEQYWHDHHHHHQRGRGRGRRGGPPVNLASSIEPEPPAQEEGPDERTVRNAYRKNHYLNRGKSHHQQKKGKPGGGGGGPAGQTRGGGAL